VKRWDFHKADWKRFCLLTSDSVERLPPPDTTNIEKAYQEYCESLLSAAKQCIPRDCRKNYALCWDKEGETLYRSFVRTPVGTDSNRAAASLLFRLEWALSKDMTTLGEYLKTWKLKLSTTKTVSAVFHLNNKELSMS